MPNKRTKAPEPSVAPLSNPPREVTLAPEVMDGALEGADLMALAEHSNHWAAEVLAASLQVSSTADPTDASTTDGTSTVAANAPRPVKVHEFTHGLQQHLAGPVADRRAIEGEARDAEAAYARRDPLEIRHAAPRHETFAYDGDEPRSLAHLQETIDFAGDAFVIEVETTDDDPRQVTVRLTYTGGEDPNPRRLWWHKSRSASTRGLTPRVEVWLESEHRYFFLVDLYGDGTEVLEFQDIIHENRSWTPPVRKHQFFDDLEDVGSAMPRSIDISPATAVPTSSLAEDTGSVGDAAATGDLADDVLLALASESLTLFQSDPRFGVTKAASWSRPIAAIRTDQVSLSDDHGLSAERRARANAVVLRSAEARNVFVGLTAMSPREIYPTDIADEAVSMVTSLQVRYAESVATVYQGDPAALTSQFEAHKAQWSALPHRITGLYLRYRGGLQQLIGGLSDARWSIDQIRSRASPPDPRRPIYGMLGFDNEGGSYAKALRERLGRVRDLHADAHPDTGSLVAYLAETTLLQTGCMSLVALYEQFAYYTDELTGMLGQVIDAFGSTNESAARYRDQFEGLITRIEQAVANDPQRSGAEVQTILGEFSTIAGSEDFRQTVEQIQGRLTTIAVIELVGKALVVLGLAALTSGAAGAAAAGALSGLGLSATAVRVGVFATEVVAFTAAERLGNELIMGGNEKGWAENLATNTVMFGFLKFAAALHGRIFKLAADASTARVIAHQATGLGTSFAALQLFAEGHHVFEHGEIMSGEDRTFSLGQNLVILVFLHIGGHLAKPLNERIGQATYEAVMQSPAAYRIRVSNIEGRSRALQEKIARVSESGRMPGEETAPLLKELRDLWDTELVLWRELVAEGRISEAQRDAIESSYLGHLAELELKLASLGVESSFGPSTSFRPLGGDVVAYEEGQLGTLRTFYERAEGTLEEVSSGVFIGRLGAERLLFVPLRSVVEGRRIGEDPTLAQTREDIEAPRTHERLEPEATSGKAEPIPGSPFRGDDVGRSNRHHVEAGIDEALPDIGRYVTSGVVRPVAGQREVTVEVDGTTHTVRIEITASMEPVATYEITPGGAIVRVSQSSRKHQVRRALAHELEEVSAELLRRARGATTPAHDALTEQGLVVELSPHDHGRIAELKVLEADLTRRNRVGSETINEIGILLRHLRVMKETSWQFRDDGPALVRRRLIREAGIDLEGLGERVGIRDPARAPPAPRADGEATEVTAAEIERLLPTELSDVLADIGLPRRDVVDYIVHYHNTRSGGRYVRDLAALEARYPHLSRAEVWVVDLYTTKLFYNRMNTILRTGDARALAAVARLEGLLKGAISKLIPLELARAYRSLEIGEARMPSFLTNHPLGGTIRWPAFSSVAPSRDLTFWGRPEADILFEIRRPTVYDITPFSDSVKYGENAGGAEQIILGGVELRVLEVNGEPGPTGGLRYIIVLEQLPTR